MFKKCVSVKDETGRFNPKYDENDTMTVECENVFLSIGQAIVWGDMLKDTKVELGRGNGVVADGLTYQTAEPDIFAGGDVYTGPKFAIDAIAAGKKAAVSIHRFVQPHSSMTIGHDKREFIELDKSNIKVEGYDNTPRQVPGKKTASEVGSKFKETKVCFTEEQIKKETARCLSCGQSVVDENKCIGCGVCTTKCAFDAIHLHREHPNASRMIKSEDKLKAILPNILKREIKILLNPNRNSLEK